MKKLVTIFFLFSFYVASAQVSKVWVADNGDGTYKNPIINADFDWFRAEK